MKQKKFQLEGEIPLNLQSAIIGGQGSEGISITISLTPVTNFYGRRDKDSDGDETSTTESSSIMKGLLP